MATVTEPIMTDATGQSIDSKLNSLLGKMDNLAAAFQPNASGIVYSNTTCGLTGDDVQEAIDEMAADVSEIKQSLSNLIKSRVISGTTTATGALALPNDISSDKIISCKYTIASGALGLVYPRGDGYVTCLASSLQPFSNTSVEVIIWYTS